MWGPAVAEIVRGAGIAVEIVVAVAVRAAVDADADAAVVPVGAAVAVVTADTVVEAAEDIRTFRHGSRSRGLVKFSSTFAE